MHSSEVSTHVHSNPTGKPEHLKTLIPEDLKTNQTPVLLLAQQLFTLCAVLSC
jgi:hypothetical protein